MEIDFVAFYDQSEGTLRFRSDYSIKTDTLARGLMIALDDLVTKCPYLTAADVQDVTAIRVLIQIREGNFGQQEPAGAPAAEEPPGLSPDRETLTRHTRRPSR